MHNYYSLYYYRLEAGVSRPLLLRLLVLALLITRRIPLLLALLLVALSSPPLGPDCFFAWPSSCTSRKIQERYDGIRLRKVKRVKISVLFKANKTKLIDKNHKTVYTYCGSAARGEVEGADSLAQVVHSRGYIHKREHLAVAAQRVL